VTQDTIIDYIMVMKADQEYASSTVARKVAAIKSFFHYLVDQGKLQDDPTATLDSPKVRKRLPKAIAENDLERLLSEPAREHTAKALRDRALLELLYATGLRVTELVSLNVDDVNLASATLRVVRPKDKVERIVPIHERAIEPMQEYLERARMQLVHDPKEQSLFLNHRGRRLTRQGLWLIVKHYVREVGIVEDVTPHTLRHTFAAHLVEKKADLEYVQEILDTPTFPLPRSIPRWARKNQRTRRHPGAVNPLEPRRDGMGYVERILGDNERVVYSTHQHAIVLLGRLLGSLFAFVVFLGLGLAVLIPDADEAGNEVRFIVGVIALCSLVLPLYLIVSAWLEGLRGRDLVRRIWRAVVAGILILAFALIMMFYPGVKPIAGSPLWSPSCLRSNWLASFSIG